MKANYKDLIILGRKMVLLSGTLAGLLSYSLISYAQDDSWQQKRSLGLATASRSEAVSFSIGGKGYVGTGATLGPGNDFWEYDPITDAWTQKADVPGGARLSALAFSIGDKGYIGLGSGVNHSPYYSDFYEYDPATNVWTRKADFRGGARLGATAFSIGNKGYAGTGAMRSSSGQWLNDSSTIDFWEFDPASNLWTQKANFPGTARVNASGFSIGEKGYIGLGGNRFYPNNGYNDFWEYNPATDIWVKKANFAGTQRYGAASFTIGNKGYVGTGYVFWGGSANDFWEYDPLTNTWTQKANYGGDPRERAIGFSIGNKGYIGTGYRSNSDYTFGPKCDLWAYDPALNQWAQKASLGDGARMYAAGFGIDGKGYVGIGYDGGPKKDFYQYDPATDQWLRKANFAGGERHHATAFGINGKGYMGQGYSRGRQTFVNDFWQYDPVADTWKQGTSPFSLARADATVFELGGKVYFGLGYYYATNLHDFWEFDPATGVWTKIYDWLDLNSTGGFTVGNKSYVLVTYLWEYDLATHTWIKKHEKAADAEVIGFTFTLNNKGYLLFSNESWEYDLANNSWTPRKAFPGKSRVGPTVFTIGDHAYLGFGSINDVLQNDLWEYTPASEHSITTNLATTTFCSGETAAISYTAKGTYNEGNIFTAELSDTSGEFSVPQILGTNTSILSGTINIRIPDSLRTGQMYRIRVVSSNPAITGSDNGADIVVNPLPVARAKGMTVYLNERGIATTYPQAIDSGSTANCGISNITLDKNKFDCGNIGSNRITLTVVDRNGNVATDTAVVTVLDTLPPRILGAYAIPNTLWPPNHKMKEVTLLYWASDNCSVINNSLSVTSDELQSAGVADWVILDDHHVLLRAEKNGTHKERLYFITITSKDLSGNTTTKVVTVGVSPDQGEDGWLPVGIKKLIVSILPNPSNHHFTLIFRSNSTQSINMQVTDILGRLIDARSNIPPNGTLQIGSNYKPGTYYILVVQGKQRLTLRIVKQ